MEEKEELNVSVHMLVPKHELVLKEEANEILKQFNAKPDQFPFILSRDPAAVEIGAKAGDLIRITRRSETAGETIYYRYVVEG